MKGLLYKDACTLARQAGLMLALVVLFGCLQRGSMTGVAIFYAAMLPVTALAYDEQSKWDKMAAGMPYTQAALVGSKYVLGAICTGGAALICLLVQTLIDGFSAEAAYETVLLLALAFGLLTVELPAMFRFGVEKGRLLFLLLTCGAVSAVLLWRDAFVAWLDTQQSPAPMMLVTVAVVLALTAVSLPLSMRMYRLAYRE